MRFPYFNPEGPLFRERLARMAAGQRQEIPTGGLLGLFQWGVSVSHEASVPPSAPITARDESVSSRSGPVEASVGGRTWRLAVHLPETTVVGARGVSTMLGARLYWRTDWAGLNTIATFGYETTWRAKLPTPDDVVPAEALPGSGGSVGVNLKIAGVRLSLSVLVLLLVLLGLLGAAYAIHQLIATSPLGGLQPGPVLR